MATSHTEPPIRSVWVFFALTFGIAWGIVVILIAFQDALEAVLGELSAGHPLFILAVYAPAIAAFSLVLWHGGWTGIRAFLFRLTLWRAHIGWYGVMLVVVPLIFYMGALIGGLPLAPPEPRGLAAMIGLMAFMLVLGPVEEFGWRGYALPLMQRRMTPFWAGLWLGVVWAVWHLPAFYLGGTPQSQWDILPFMVGAVAVSVIVTGFFNAAGGSILVSILFHWQLVLPIWPDAQPWDVVLFIVLAGVVVWVDRRRMFSGQDAATEVMPRR